MQIGSIFTKMPRSLRQALVIFWSLILCGASVTAQVSITISAGTTVTMSGGSKLHVSRNWTNNGTFTPGDGTAVFDGATPQTITNANAETFNKLIVDKSSGDLTLNDDVTVTDTLTLTNGNVSTGANTLTLGVGSEGTLSRTGGTIVGNFSRHIDTTTGTRLFPVGTASNYRPLTTDYSTAPTSAGTVTVSHTSPGGNFANLSPALDDAGYTVERRSTMFWTMTASSIAGGTYDLAIDAAGQVGITNPVNLRVIHSTDGLNFNFVGTHSNGSGTTAKRMGIDGSIFERFYIGGNISDNSLPVELSAFSGTVIKDGVRLQWQTASETNNLGFHVYRSKTKDGEYVSITPTLIKGHGTDSTPHDYSFLDETAEEGQTYWYLIEDVDFSGVTERSDPIKMVFSRKAVLLEVLPAEFALYQNYPNPFNPETWIPYDLAADAEVTITIYNAQGQRIRHLSLGIQPAGGYLTKDKAAYWDGRSDTRESVSSGVYFYRLRAGDFYATKKMLIVK